MSSMERRAACVEGRLLVPPEMLPTKQSRSDRRLTAATEAVHLERKGTSFKFWHTHEERECQKNSLICCVETLKGMK